MPSKVARTERLTCGEGVEFGRGGPLNRINSIFTGNVATFSRPATENSKRHGAAWAEKRSLSLIADVTDDLHDSRKFYEIVPGGLREDAKAFADRLHEWNGITAAGMPAYLIGADYVKTFNQDNFEQNQQIYVTLSRPAKLFVFLDVRVTAPDWLRRDFHNTGDMIGLDAAPNRMRQYRNRTLAVGPGQSIDERYTIWERDVLEPGVVALGSNIDPSDLTTDRGMYGIAALELNPTAAPKNR